MPNKTTKSADFILKPKTVKEFEHNVQFQIDNIRGWMSVKDYECALIKAKCLVNTLEKLVEQMKHDGSRETDDL